MRKVYVLRSVAHRLCEKGPGCGHLEQKPDGQRASMEAGWATSHG